MTNRFVGGLTFKLNTGYLGTNNDIDVWIAEIPGEQFKHYEVQISRRTSSKIYEPYLWDARQNTPQSLAVAPMRSLDAALETCARDFATRFQGVAP